MTCADDARWLDRLDDVEGLAVHHNDALGPAHIEEPLPAVRRERQILRKRNIGTDELLHERAVRQEHLHTPVLAVGDVDHPVIVSDPDRMRDVEVRWTTARRETRGIFHIAM